jgi:hypothetical protein
MKKLLILAFCVGLFACSSPPVIDLQQISIGDDKGVVLHKLGNPDRTYFKEGTHRWVYKVKNTAGLVAEKEIWFQESQVVFVDEAPRAKKEPIPFEPVQ